MPDTEIKEQLKEAKEDLVSVKEEVRDAQLALTTASQRRINLIWECTQATVAILVTIAIITSALLKLTSMELSNAFFLIIGFYFSRTNHQATGGIGTKILSNYKESRR